MRNLDNVLILKTLVLNKISAKLKINHLRNPHYALPSVNNYSC